jgi:predicted lipid carrier protein YhbT
VQQRAQVESNESVMMAKGNYEKSALFSKETKLIKGRTEMGLTLKKRLDVIEEQSNRSGN